MEGRLERFCSDILKGQTEPKSLPRLLPVFLAHGAHRLWARTTCSALRPGDGRRYLLISGASLPSTTG